MFSRPGRLFGSIGALTAMLLAVACGQPAPTKSTSGRQSEDRIVFGRADDIYVMNADGTGVTKLTSDPAFEASPKWSPDGSRIAFVRDLGTPDAHGQSMEPKHAMFVMAADGTGAQQVGKVASGPILGLSWSPDGSRIAFSRFSAAGQSPDIYVINADGTGTKRLIDDPAFAVGPAFSPDSTKIAFVGGRDGNEEIYVANADGSAVKRLTNSPDPDIGPSWSPDGGRIAFWHGPPEHEDIYVMNADGTGVTQLTKTPTSIDTSPVWSPDGSKIAFQSEGPTTSGFDILVMNADGSGVRQLTNDPRPDQDPDWRRLGEQGRSSLAGTYRCEGKDPADPVNTLQLRSDGTLILSSPSFVNPKGETVAPSNEQGSWSATGSSVKLVGKFADPGGDTFTVDGKSLLAGGGDLICTKT